MFIENLIGETLKNKVEVNVMKNTRISVRQYIELKRIADLLNCALDSDYGSSYYWCEWLTGKSVKPENLDFMYDDERVTVYRNIDYPLNRGGSITLQISGDENDKDNGKQFVLNLKEIKYGLTCMSKKYPRHYADFLSENENAGTGDVFLQCCLFGEIIYG